MAAGQGRINTLPNQTWPRAETSSLQNAKNTRTHTHAHPSKNFRLLNAKAHRIADAMQMHTTGCRHTLLPMPLAAKAFPPSRSRHGITLAKPAEHVASHPLNVEILLPAPVLPGSRIV